MSQVLDHRKATIGDKIVEGNYIYIENKRIHTPPPPLHFKVGYLLFSIGS